MNNPASVPGLGRSIVLGLFLSLIGSCLGATVHWDRLQQIFSGTEESASTARMMKEGQAERKTNGPQPVELEDIQGLTAEGALLVDARSAKEYADGHLPGARSLPMGENASWVSFRMQIALDRTLIVYCSGYDCPDSFDLATRLVNAGYRDVRVFEGGVPQWQAAGFLLEQKKD